MIKKGKFRIVSDGQHLFWCPGCEEYHGIYVTGYASNRPACVVWDFDGNYDKPTINPSILAVAGDQRCHSFIKEGKIQFLGDCSHALAGQTVDMVSIETHDIEEAGDSEGEVL